jgi:hypothetical protein
MVSMGEAQLSGEEFAKAMAVVLAYLEDHPSITNREFRSLTRFNYDQAIWFFNRMVAEGVPLRVGKTSSIKYVLPPAS